MTKNEILLENTIISKVIDDTIRYEMNRISNKTGITDFRKLEELAIVEILNDCMGYAYYYPKEFISYGDFYDRKDEILKIKEFINKFVETNKDIIPSDKADEILDTNYAEAYQIEFLENEDENKFRIHDTFYITSIQHQAEFDKLRVDLEYISPNLKDVGIMVLIETDEIEDCSYSKLEKILEDKLDMYKDPRDEVLYLPYFYSAMGDGSVNFIFSKEYLYSDECLNTVFHDLNGIRRSEAKRRIHEALFYHGCIDVLYDSSQLEYAYYDDESYYLDFTRDDSNIIHLMLDFSRLYVPKEVYSRMIFTVPEEVSSKMILNELDDDLDEF